MGDKVDSIIEAIKGLEERLEERLEEKIHGVKEEIQGLEKRLEERLEEKIHGVKEEIQGLEERLEKRLEEKIHGVKEDIQGLEKRLEEKIQGIEKNYNLLSNEINIMKRVNEFNYIGSLGYKIKHPLQSFSSSSFIGENEEVNSFFKF